MVNHHISHNAKCSDEDFINLWRETNGSPAEIAKRIGCSERAVYARRNRIEERRKLRLAVGSHAGSHRGDGGTGSWDYNPRIKIEGFAGSVVIFSDCHWWPEISQTVAYDALLAVIKELKPQLIIGNGDLLDGARISRFAPARWENRPRMAPELEEVKERCAEIRHSHLRGRCIRTIGNHDDRFDKWLAANAGDFEGIKGFRLKDHLPAWEECVAVWINDKAVIKHRWHGGIHAAYNNTMRSGMTFVTGHTHELEVKPYADYRGRRYGVQTGTLAEPLGVQFAYAEDNPSRACSGFVVLTFRPDGSLAYPELCEVVDDVAWFRGKRMAWRKRAA